MWQPANWAAGGKRSLVSMRKFEGWYILISKSIWQIGQHYSLQIL